MDGTVTIISTDGEIIATYPAGAAPAKILSVGDEIWVALTSDHSVVRLDP